MATSTDGSCRPRLPGHSYLDVFYVWQFYCPQYGFLWFVSVWISLSLCPCCCIFNAKSWIDFAFACRLGFPLPFIYDFTPSQRYKDMHLVDAQWQAMSAGCLAGYGGVTSAGLWRESRLETFPFCHCLFWFLYSEPRLGLAGISITIPSQSIKLKVEAALLHIL